MTIPQLSASNERCVFETPLEDFTCSGAHQWQFQSSEPIRNTQRRGKFCELLFTLQVGVVDCFFFFFFECHHGGKAFPSNVSCAFRHKDVFCVNGPLHYSFPSPFPRQTVIPDCLILSRTSGCCHWNFIASSLSVSFTSIYF